MKNFHVLLITVVLTIVALFIFPPVASGAERRIPGLSCVEAEPTQRGPVNFAPAITDGARYVDGVIRGAPGGFEGIKIQCPVPDDDTFPKSAVRVLTIRGRTTGVVTGRACSRTSDNFFRCTSNVTVRGVADPDRPDFGDFGLIFDNFTLLPAWGPEHVNNFGYVEIEFQVPLPTFPGQVEEPTGINQFLRNRDVNFVTGIFLSTVGD